MSVFYILGAILGLGLLIVVHEAGHFVVARLCGMRVERFSIGFGPGILRWRSKAGTLFQVAPIPFGGFVEIKGMAIAEDVEPDDRAAYPNRPVWQRIATIFAGPGTNWLTAIVLGLALFTCAGIPEATSYYAVDSVNKEFDASGKLLPGDRLLAINGTPIFLEGPDGKRTELCTVTAKLGDRPARITILRGGKEMVVDVVPKLDTFENAKPDPTMPKECQGPRYRLGIDGYREQRDRVDVGVVEAAGHAFTWPARIAREHVTGLVKVIRGEAEGELVGPVGITTGIKRQIQAGWVSAISVLIFLNVLLAIMNLLPLPGLDGGRLAFLGYELVTRRRANAKVETTVHMVGIFFLMIVLVMVTFKECRALL
jgi:regulator of sigma E protease